MLVIQVKQSLKNCGNKGSRGVSLEVKVILDNHKKKITVELNHNTIRHKSQSILEFGE